MVPAQERLRLDEYQRAPQSGEHGSEGNQQGAVGGTEPGPPHVADGNQELLSEKRVLGKELRLGTREISQNATDDAGRFAWGGREGVPHDLTGDRAKSADYITRPFAKNPEHGLSKP